jgi:hypothetical protein
MSSGSTLVSAHMLYKNRSRRDNDCEMRSPNPLQFNHLPILDTLMRRAPLHLWR